MRGSNSRSGVTLTELMVATAILTIGILGFFGAFRYITQSIHVSRTRTLATNLAQEKIETLKNLSYYELLITTPTYGVDSTISPSVLYDQNNYPPETVNIGGVSFTRYTFVAMAQVVSDVISTVTWTYPDTGMKQITSTIIWSDSGGVKKYWTLTNLLENPNVNPLDASMTGTVNTAAGTLSGAVVKVQQNPDWQALTNSVGSYSFRVFHGSYTVRASSTGYWDNVSPVQSITAGSSNNVPAITLTAIATGTIKGEAWFNTDLDISAISASSSTKVMQAGSMNTQTVEYVELYNPTTYPIAISNTAKTAANYTFNFYGTNVAGDVINGGFNFTYVSSAVGPNQYYLIANASYFMENGQWVAPDAYYPSTWVLGPASDKNYMSATGCGAWVVTNASGRVADQVGWGGTSGNCNGGGRPSSSYYYGSYIPLDAWVDPINGATSGIAQGNYLVRSSSPAANASVISAYGRAYNSVNNTNDFLYPSIAGYNASWGGQLSTPRTTNSGQYPVLTGVPAVWAYVSASDPFSGSTVAFNASITSNTLALQIATFTLVGVATTPVDALCAGLCWTVTVATDTYFASISTVAIGPNSGSVISIPYNGTTGSVPGQPLASSTSFYHVLMTSSSVGGFIKGNVTDVNANNLSGIDISISGVSPDKITGPNGNFFAATTTSGTVTIVANPNNQNLSYVQLIANVNVNSGQITAQNFILLQGGSLQGYITSGTTPLPDYVFTAYTGDGSQAGQAGSNSSGIFTIHNLSTGTYTVYPTLDVGQSATAQTATPGVTIQNNNQMVYTLTTPGATVFIGSVTLSGAYGTITGSVTVNGSLLTTGALVIASTDSTTSTSLPSIVASSSPAYGYVVYADSSKADGTYTLSVRGSNTYYLNVFVPTINTQTGAVTTSTKTYSNIYVTPAAATSQGVTVP